MIRAVLILSVLFAVAAQAQSRIAVLAFKGPKAAKAQAQLQKSLCKAETCVKPGKHGNDVEVDAVLLGTVKKAGKAFTLEVKVYASEDSPPVIKKIPLSRSGSIASVPNAVKSLKSAIAEQVAAAESEEDSGGGYATSR